jgi:heme/copper-type cytochrome/quinol oxidase subunit 2
MTTIQLGILQLFIGLCAILVGGLIVYFVVQYNIKKEKQKKERQLNKVHNYEI